jgi:hypothetical protein
VKNFKPLSTSVRTVGHVCVAFVRRSKLFCGRRGGIVCGYARTGGRRFFNIDDDAASQKKGGGHDERGADQDFVFHFGFLCLFQPQSRLVRIAGLEPAIILLSSLYMFAFLYTSLLVMLRHYPHDCKLIFASVGN